MYSRSKIRLATEARNKNWTNSNAFYLVVSVLSSILMIFAILVVAYYIFIFISSPAIRFILRISLFAMLAQVWLRIIVKWARKRWAPKVPL